MRLLKFDDQGELSLTEDLQDDIPPYAILSHTWGDDKDEVNFDDLKHEFFKNKAGYTKIRFCGEQAQKDRLEYFWVDTCCINKANHTELSEAITSMFRWYRDAVKCYVYLLDVSVRDQDDDYMKQTWKLAFQKSRWFTRGWTLQELIAPAFVEFFSREGERLGSKNTLEQQIHEITGIPISALRAAPLAQFSVDERMRWAGKRNTKRKEDKAYCLLGIFDIFMPLIYGEGENAFIRLKAEIDKSQRRPSSDRGNVHRAVGRSSNTLFTGRKDAFKQSPASKYLPAPERNSSFSRGEVLKWISDIDVSQHHNNICRDRLKDSGLWLLKRAEFRKWMEEETSSILWLTGIPGSGKTKLLSIVIDHISQNPADLLAYFYCSRSPGERERGDAEDILRSILRQLSCPSSASPVWEPLQQKYEGLQNQGLELNKLLLDDAKNLIIDLSEQHPSMTIVIASDAIDECNVDKRFDLLDSLNDIVGAAQNMVKILVSSRHDGNLASQLSNSIRLQIREEDNANDIRRFVSDKVGTEIQKKRLLRGEVSPALKEHVVKTLVHGAQGMFSWVALQIQRLCRDRMITERDIREKLQHLPPGLTETYSTIYQQIMSLPGADSRNTAQRALKLLLCAQKQLSTNELLAAASLESRTIFKEVTNQEMLDMCCNLVVLDDQMGVLRFAHLSVREYLEEREADAVTLAHALTAETCLVFCLYGKSDLETPGTSLSKGKTFHEYATLHWATHCRMSGKYIHEGKLGQLFDQFISADIGDGRSPFAECIHSAYRYAQKRPRNDPLRAKMESVFSSPPNPFLLGCAWGFADIIKSRIKSAWKVTESVNQRGQTGLRIASEYGQLDIVELLLAHDADIDAKARDESTPLHGASEKGKHEVVRLLLEKGANVEAKERSGKTALHHASTMGDEATVQLLLEHGAPYKASDKCGWTPLHCASHMGHEGVVRMLLEKGADIEAQDDCGCTALYLASEQGHEQVATLLIEQDAAVDTMDEYGGSALCRAVEKNHEGIVRLLLQSGASVAGPEAVHSAAERGTKRILELLINHGADIETEDSLGMRALHQASIGGHVKVVQYLLDKGADIELPVENGCGPLYLAVAGGHEDVVRLFLGKGAAVNARETGGKTPLHEAAYWGYAQIVRLLVAGGADLAASDDTGRTAIHYAAAADTEGALQFLLEQGEDDERMDNFGWTAWHWAAMEDCEAVAKLLLEHRGSVYEGTDNFGRTALDWAIERRHEKVANVLEQDVFYDARAD